MLSTSLSLFSFFSVIATLAHAKPHAHRHWHQQASRADSTSDSTTSSGSTNIGILYDGSSDLSAFSGKIGFSVDWSPVPLSSSNGLDLGTFIPQLWTFQDGNRESQYHQPFTSTRRSID